MSFSSITKKTWGIAVAILLSACAQQKTVPLSPANSASRLERIPTDIQATRILPQGQVPWDPEYQGLTPSGNGILVGPRIGLPPATACNQALLAPSENLGLLENFPADVACAEIGKTFATSVSYVGSDQNCYQADLTGTYQINCRVGLPSLPATTSLPFSAIPNILDPSFNWVGANAVCFHVAGDIGAEGVYGVPYQSFCGASNVNFPSVLQNQQAELDSLYNTYTNPNQSNSNSTQQGSLPVGQAPWDPEYQGLTPSGNGVLVGPRIGLPPATACNQALLAPSENLGLLENFPADVACNEIGKTFATSVSYVGSDGKCYQADLTGTYQINCRVGLPSLPATTSLPFSAIPNVLDTSFNWVGANAVCFHVAGDIGAEGVYGVPYQSFCGASNVNFPQALQTQQSEMDTLYNAYNPGAGRFWVTY